MLQLTTDIPEQRKLIRCAELMLIKIALDAKSTHDLAKVREYEAQAQKTIHLLEILRSGVMMNILRFFTLYDEVLWREK